MLTEDERDFIVEDIGKNLIFTFLEFTPEVTVLRYGEGFDRSNPYVLVQFMPANRKKFQSISDMIGFAPQSPKGQYKQYGYCQIEVVSIYCYCGEFHNERNLNGRKLTYHLSETILFYILRNWEKLLYHMYASFDRAEDLIIKDVSTYEPNTGSMIYCYSIDVYLKTQFNWDKVPDGFEEEDEEIVREVGVYVKSTNEDEYKFIKRIKVI